MNQGKVRVCVWGEWNIMAGNKERVIKSGLNEDKMDTQAGIPTSTPSGQIVDKGGNDTKSGNVDGRPRYVAKGVGIGIGHQEIPKRRSPMPKTQKSSQTQSMQRKLSGSGEGIGKKDGGHNQASLPNLQQLQLQQQLYTSRSSFELCTTPATSAPSILMNYDIDDGYAKQGITPYYESQRNLSGSLSMFGYTHVAQAGQHLLNFYTPHRSAALTPVARRICGSTKARHLIKDCNQDDANEITDEPKFTQVVGPSVEQLTEGSAKLTDHDSVTDRCLNEDRTMMKEGLLNRTQVQLVGAKADETGIKAGRTTVEENRLLIPTSAAVTAVSNTMPTTTVVMTTSVTTAVHTCLTQSTSVTVASMDEEYSGGASVLEGKRKQCGAESEDQPGKRRNLNTEPEGGYAMQQVLQKLTGIEQVMCDMNTTIRAIQAENVTWKQKLGLLKSDVEGLKDSVELAHQLIGDEKTERLKNENEIRAALKDRTVEMGDNVEIIKTQVAEMRNVKESVTALQTRVSLIDKNQQDMKVPITELRGKIKAVCGPIEFPTEATLVAQNVWCTDEENLHEVASVIIHKALNVPHIKILCCERKSGEPGGSGLIKIELENCESLQEVLCRKCELKNNRVKELWNVFLRQSKKTETLVAERNMDLVL